MLAASSQDCIDADEVYIYSNKVLVSQKIAKEQINLILDCWKNLIIKKSQLSAHIFLNFVLLSLSRKCEVQEIMDLFRTIKHFQPIKSFQIIYAMSSKGNVFFKEIMNLNADALLSLLFAISVETKELRANSAMRYHFLKMLEKPRLFAAQCCF